MKKSKAFIGLSNPKNMGASSIPAAATTLFRTIKKPTKLIGCAGFLGLCKTFFGGGGGNRTRVRKLSAVGSTCLSQSLSLAGHYPTGREDVRRFR